LLRELNGAAEDVPFQSQAYAALKRRSSTVGPGISGFARFCKINVKGSGQSLP
jgi:hypothetical protein